MFSSRWLTIAFIVIAGPVLATSLDIGPTRIQMIGPERTATMTIRNSDSAPTNVQVRTLDWSQANGSDQYTPSTTLLASPPQAALAPGDSQVIRLVVENLSSNGSERAFRLVIDQIPASQAPDGTGAGVRTAIRALVPVFITPSTQDRPKLSWNARRSGSAVVLSASNSGVAHDRLVSAVVSAGGKQIGDPIEGYVLGKATRSWTIVGVPAGATSVRIVGDGDFGQVQADVPITS